MIRGRCRTVPRGWVCDYGHGHNGACPAQPAWWNLRAQLRVRDAARRADGPSEWLLIAGLLVVLAAAGLAVWGAR